MIAFYAPMKPPTHATPSGDRQIARNLLALLPNAELVSDLRVYDGQGNENTQSALIQAATQERARLVDALRVRKPKAWVTYHNYYKAPDLLGPHVASALGVPYLLIEATRAKKRLHGPWATFAALAEEASDAADAILYFTQYDKEALEQHRAGAQHLIHLPPFLPDRTLPAAAAPEPNAPVLAVGMMRPGDKLASYTLIAETLHLMRGDWRLDIAGDGPARADVEALMAPFGNQVRFLGQLNADGLSRAYARACGFLWPGVGEAFGMVYLEAQARGLRVIAQDRPGVRDVLAPGHYPLVKDGPAGLARCLKEVLSQPVDSDKIRRYIAQNHLAPAAQATIERAISAVAL